MRNFRHPERFLAGAGKRLLPEAAVVPRTTHERPSHRTVYRHLPDEEERGGSQEHVDQPRPPKASAFRDERQLVHQPVEEARRHAALVKAREGRPSLSSSPQRYGIVPETDEYPYKRTDQRQFQGDGKVVDARLPNQQRESIKDLREDRRASLEKLLQELDAELRAPWSLPEFVPPKANLVSVGASRAVERRLRYAEPDNDMFYFAEQDQWDAPMAQSVMPSDEDGGLETVEAHNGRSSARYEDLDVEMYAGGAGDDDPSEMRSMNGKWYREQVRPKLPDVRYYGDRYGSAGYGEKGAYRHAIHLSEVVHGEEDRRLKALLRQSTNRADHVLDQRHGTEYQLRNKKDNVQHGYGLRPGDYRAASEEINELKADIDRLKRERLQALEQERSLSAKMYDLGDRQIRPIIGASRRGFDRESHHTKPERARGTGQSPRNTPPYSPEEVDS